MMVVGRAADVRPGCASSRRDVSRCSSRLVLVTPLDHVEPIHASQEEPDRDEQQEHPEDHAGRWRRAACRKRHRHVTDYARCGSRETCAHHDASRLRLPPITLERPQGGEIPSYRERRAGRQATPPRLGYRLFSLSSGETLRLGPQRGHDPRGPRGPGWAIPLTSSLSVRSRIRTRDGFPQTPGAPSFRATYGRSGALLGSLPPSTGESVQPRAVPRGPFFATRASGWQGRVVRPIRDGHEWALVEEWLPSSQLSATL